MSDERNFWGDDRRQADVEYRMHMQQHIDDLEREIRGLTIRVNEVENRTEQRHHENSTELAKIKAALFDEEGVSQIKLLRADILVAIDLLRGSKVMAKIVAWFVIVAGGAIAAYKAIRP
jgi:hypothetical protein